MIQIAPLVLNSIWDSDMMTKYTDDVTGRKKWRCGHCGKEWFEHNATKALGHVVGIVKDIKACRVTISPHYKEAYLNSTAANMTPKHSNFNHLLSYNPALKLLIKEPLRHWVKEHQNIQQIWDWWI